MRIFTRLKLLFVQMGGGLESFIPHGSLWMDRSGSLKSVMYLEADVLGTMVIYKTTMGDTEVICCDTVEHFVSGGRRVEPF